MSKVICQCQSWLGKDFRLLKVIFILVAAYLIVDVFYTFSVLKPTYTTRTKRNWGTEDFPEIILCPEPSIDINATRSHGYQGMSEYFLGTSNKMLLIGWAGNSSNDVNKVSEEISALKSIEDCPLHDLSLFWYKGNKSTDWGPIKFTLIKALHPYHICCKAVVPTKVSQSFPIMGVQFGFSSRFFKVFMQDRLTASIFDQHKAKMLGDKIVTGIDSFINYKVKLMEDQKLEQDPEYPCIDYKVIGEYSNCIRDELVEQNMAYINCTPPWMTDNEDLWCKGRIAVSSEVMQSNYINYLIDVSVSDASSEKCLVPCKVKSYQVNEIGKKEMEDNGLIVYFEKEVDVTKSALTIDIKTLISNIGGFIGISKNFLWLIIVFISSVGALMSHFKIR